MTRFAGYAAVFDRVDRGGDVIRRGAFARAEARFADGERLPVLWGHDRARPIGRVETLAEDAQGLRIVGRLTAAVPVVAGAGLSFGYRIRRLTEGTNRELLDLDLVEVSVVNEPMQPLARVHAVTEQGDNE